MGYVLLVPEAGGWRLPRELEADARADRLVGRYRDAEVWVAPVDGDELPGDWFDPAALPAELDAVARAAVGDLIRGQYDVVREEL